MLGRMQDQPLLINQLIDHAALNHGAREIVTNTVEGGIHRYTWADCHKRSKQLAQALERLGAKPGDRVATLAWNTYRHVEALYGISGMGGVAHTINPRLFAEQIVYIANHAEDLVLLFDITFAPLIEKLAPLMTTVKHFVAMTDLANMPSANIPKLLCYEQLLAAEDGDYAWVQLDERAPAGLCFTSGTTGNPKGVLYSHRSQVLHTMAACQMDAMALSARSCVLPVAPMFHVNAWGTPFATAACGAKLVLNGPAFDPGTLHKLIIDERVNFTAAVPTVWLGLVQYLEKTGHDLGELKAVVIGGSAVPRSMIETFRDKYGVQVIHAWGMTEMSPLGSLGSLNAAVAELSPDAQLDYQCKQGRAPFGVEMKLVDDEGNRLPRDGKTFGRLLVKGPWIIGQYFKGDGGDILDSEGFFDTGDVATIDEMGYMQITDRAKDVIKSGGEWISSIDLENTAVGCPGVAEAAVIGIHHPKWDERPLLIIVRKPGSDVSKEDMLSYLSPRIAKWWMPDDVVFVDELPHTATGKIQKLTLRQQFRDYVLPTAMAAAE
jgi:acyl-CoA synthetase (AMP-forming)/AMP-acid ligase II